MRLQAQAKAGFYPTPPAVVDRVARFITVGSFGRHGTAKLLDPCCGTGAALRQVSDMLAEGETGAEFETYGIELHQGRFQRASEVLDHALCSDLFQTSVANGAFHLLFLNPPYDYDDDKLRQEHKFLLHCTRYLCPDGLLVFIVPQSRLAVSARYLASHYSHLTCYRFPDPEFEGFRQVVLLATRRPEVLPDPSAETMVKAWSSEASLESVDKGLPVLPESGHPQYALAPGPRTSVLFATRFLDSGAAVQEARRHGLWASPALRERLWPVDTEQARPLMPLRKGHLAMLIAAGFLNNLCLEADGQRLLVKGRTYKEFVLSESTDETETYREVLRTSVMAQDLETGEYMDIQA